MGKKVRQKGLARAKQAMAGGRSSVMTPLFAQMLAVSFAPSSAQERGDAEGEEQPGPDPSTARDQTAHASISSMGMLGSEWDAATLASNTPSWQQQLGALKKIAVSFKRRKDWALDDTAAARLERIINLLLAMVFSPHDSPDLIRAALSALRCIGPQQRPVLCASLSHFITALCGSGNPGLARSLSVDAMRHHFLSSTQPLPDERIEAVWLERHFAAFDTLFHNWDAGTQCAHSHSVVICNHLASLAVSFAPVLASSQKKISVPDRTQQVSDGAAKEAGPDTQTQHQHHDRSGSAIAPGVSEVLLQLIGGISSILPRIAEPLAQHLLSLRPHLPVTPTARTHASEGPDEKARRGDPTTTSDNHQVPQKKHKSANTAASSASDVEQSLSTMKGFFLQCTSAHTPLGSTSIQHAALGLANCYVLEQAMQPLQALQTAQGNSNNDDDDDDDDEKEGTGVADCARSHKSAGRHSVASEIVALLSPPVNASAATAPLPELSTFSRLCLLRSLFECGESCYPFLVEPLFGLSERIPSTKDDGNSQPAAGCIFYPLALDFFKAAADSNDKLDSQRYVFNCVIAWANFYAKRLRNGSDLLEGREWQKALDQLLRLVWDYIDDPVDRTRHKVTDLLRSIINIVSIRASSSSQAASAFFQSLLATLREYPWTAQAKFSCLQLVAQNIGVFSLLAQWEDLPTQILRTMETASVTKPAAAAFVDFASKNRDECSARALHPEETGVTKPFELWAKTWLDPLVAALSSGTAALRKSIMELCVPKVLLLDRRAIIYGIQCLSSSARKEESAMFALTALLKYGRSSGLIETLSMEWSSVGEATHTAPTRNGGEYSFIGVLSQVNDHEATLVPDNAEQARSATLPIPASPTDASSEADTAAVEAADLIDPVICKLALVHANASISLNMLAFVCDSRKLRSPPTSFEIEAVMCFLKWTKTPSSGERKEIARSLKKFVSRIATLLTSSFFTSSTTKDAETAGAASLSISFLTWLWTHLFSLLEPYESHTSRTMGLLLISTLLDSFPIDVLERIVHSNHGGAHPPCQARMDCGNDSDDNEDAGNINGNDSNEKGEGDTDGSVSNAGSRRRDDAASGLRAFAFTTQEIESLCTVMMSTYEMNRLDAFNLLKKHRAVTEHDVLQEAMAAVVHDSAQHSPPDTDSRVHLLQPQYCIQDGGILSILRREMASIAQISTQYCALVQALHYARDMGVETLPLQRGDKLLKERLKAPITLFSLDISEAPQQGDVSVDRNDHLPTSRLEHAKKTLQEHADYIASSPRLNYFQWLLTLLQAQERHFAGSATSASAPVHGYLEAIRSLLSMEHFAVTSNTSSSPSVQGLSQQAKQKIRAGKRNPQNLQGGRDDERAGEGQSAAREHAIWSAFIAILWSVINKIVEKALPTVAALAPEGLEHNQGRDAESSPNFSRDPSSAPDQRKGDDDLDDNDNDDSAESKKQEANSKYHLVCCWRAVKEISFLKALLVVSFPFAKVGSPQHLGWDDAEALATEMRDYLLQCRHRGSVEVGASSFQAVCARFWEKDPSTPRKWLEETLSSIRSADKDTITRRSAGFPLMLLSIIKSAPQTQTPRLFDYAFHALKQILLPAPQGYSDATCAYSAASVKQPPPEVRQDGGEEGSIDADMHVVGDSSNVAIIHAYNVLRALIRDESLGKYADCYIGFSYHLAILGFQSPLFAVRNSAMMLFSNLQLRVFGNECESDEVTRQKPKSLKTLGNMYPKLLPVIKLALAGDPALASLETSHPGHSQRNDGGKGAIATKGSSNMAAQRGSPSYQLPGKPVLVHNVDQSAYLAVVFLSHVDNRRAVSDGSLDSENAELAMKMATLLVKCAWSRDIRVRRLAARAIQHIVPRTLSAHVFTRIVSSLACLHLPDRLASVQVDSSIYAEPFHDGVITANASHGLLMMLESLAKENQAAWLAVARSNPFLLAHLFENPAQALVESRCCGSGTVFTTTCSPEGKEPGAANIYVSIDPTLHLSALLHVLFATLPTPHDTHLKRPSSPGASSLWSCRRSFLYTLSASPNSRAVLWKLRAAALAIFLEGGMELPATVVRSLRSSLAAELRAASQQAHPADDSSNSSSAPGSLPDHHAPLAAADDPPATLGIVTMPGDRELQYAIGRAYVLVVRLLLLDGQADGVEPPALEEPAVLFKNVNTLSGIVKECTRYPRLTTLALLTALLDTIPSLETHEHELLSSLLRLVYARLSDPMSSLAPYSLLQDLFRASTHLSLSAFSDVSRAATSLCGRILAQMQTIHGHAPSAGLNEAVYFSLVSSRVEAVSSDREALCLLQCLEPLPFLVGKHLKALVTTHEHEAGIMDAFAATLYLLFHDSQQVCMQAQALVAKLCSVAASWAKGASERAHDDAVAKKMLEVVASAPFFSTSHSLNAFASSSRVMALSGIKQAAAVHQEPVLQEQGPPATQLLASFLGFASNRPSGRRALARGWTMGSLRDPVQAHTDLKHSSKVAAEAFLSNESFPNLDFCGLVRLALRHCRRGTPIPSKLIAMFASTREEEKGKSPSSLSLVSQTKSYRPAAVWWETFQLIEKAFVW